MKPPLLKAMLTDPHFWAPVAVFIAGLALLLHVM